MSNESTVPAAPRWQPLSAMDRRVLGVLAEKAKTTPDIYPMSLNAICTGCNQKSNRAPLMQLEPPEVEESLDRLREMGAVGLVEGYGRVQKYRHYLYDWLGVDKVELAIMTELLLRGDQTVGELRGRAARMEPIADMAALRPLLDSLLAKGLLIALTPEGRGQVVTHALHKPRELEILKANYQRVADVSTGRPEEYDETSAPSRATPPRGSVAPVSNPEEGSRTDVVSRLQRELAELRAQVSQMSSDVEEMRSDYRRLADELRGLKESLGG